MDNENSFYSNNKVLIWVLIIIVAAILLFNLLSKNRSNNTDNNVPKDYEISLVPENDIEIRIGYSSTLLATVLSDPDAKFFWSIKDSNIAKVDNGTVTALNYGTTKVTVEYTDIEGMRHEASRNVTVSDGDMNVMLQDVSFKEGELFMPVGEKYNLNLVLKPANAHVESIEYRVGNEEVVTVDNNGVVGSLNEGNTRVIARVNKTFEAVLDVHVDSMYQKAEIVVCPTSIAFSSDTRKVKIGSSEILNYNVSPSNVDHTKLSWVSSDDSIVSVDQTGRIKAKQSGKAIISVTSLNGKRDDITIEVEDNIINVTDIVLSNNEITMKVGESKVVSPIVLPSNASNKGLSYSSSNSGIVSTSASSDGTSVTLSAFKAGTATVIISSNNNLQKYLVVNVIGSSDDSNNEASEDSKKTDGSKTIKVQSDKNNLAKSYQEVINIPVSGTSTITVKLSNGVSKVKYCVYVYGSAHCTPNSVLYSNGSFTIPSGNIYVIRMIKYDYNDKEISSDSENYFNGSLYYYVNTSGSYNPGTNTVGYTIDNVYLAEPSAKQNPVTSSSEININVTDSNRYLLICYTLGTSCTPNIRVDSNYKVMLSTNGTWRIFIDEYNKSNNTLVRNRDLWFSYVNINSSQPSSSKVATIPTADLYCKSKSERMYTGNVITLTKTPGEGYHFENNTGKDISTYFVRAVLDSGYVWSDNTTSYKVISCKIEGKVVVPPTASYCNTNVKYTGYAVTLTNTPGEGYTFSNNVQTNDGTYQITAKLNTGYIWNDNTIGDKYFYCTLAKDVVVSAVKDVIIDGKITEAAETVGQRLAMLRIDTNKQVNRLYYCLGDCPYSSSVFTSATKKNPSFDIIFTVNDLNMASQVRDMWYYYDYNVTTSTYVNFRRIRSNDEEVLNMMVAYVQNGNVTNYSDVKDLDLSY